MKQLLFVFFLSVTFFTACSTNPYLKQTDLPDKINYYDEEKKFTISPDWYWRLRPTINSSNEWDTTIGHSFLNDKNGEGIVIGEYINKDKKFYIVKWNEYGYFFVKDEDYTFSQKNKKYIVPLNYGGKSIFGSSSDIDYQVIAYYQDKSSQYVGDLPAYLFANSPRSGLNLVLVSRMIFTYSLMKSHYPINSNYSDIKDVIQLYNTSGYTNQFLKITPCPSLIEFSKNESVNSISYIAFEQIGSKQYTNQYGMMFMGGLYQTKFLIIKWGKVYYALPCQ